MAKVRVHEAAKLYGLTSKAIIALLGARGEFVKAASSVLEPPVLAMLAQDLGPLPKRGVARRRIAADPISRRPLPALPRPTSKPGRARSTPRFASGTRSSSTPLAVVESPVSFADIESGLSGSPYSLPGEQREYIEETFLPLVHSLHVGAATATQRISTTGRRALGRIHRSTEIYQSNRIENLGPDLATTDRLLSTNSLDRQTQSVVAEEAISRCIDAEPKVRAVVGLGAAKLLAEQFCMDRERAMTEADIRQLHWLIMVGEHDRGEYKSWTNEIEGSSHVPPNPTDSREHMYVLVQWLNASSLSPLWRAAVVHAWFTYIHPFRDGNGRIARLLANLILIREGLPPLIVRHDDDRGRYIEALGASDAGGNILPLSRVFRRTLLRALRDMENPQFAQALFEAEVERRSAPMYDRWKVSANSFMRELASNLALHSLHLEQIGGVGNDAFSRFRNGERLNVWVAKVTSRGREQDLLLHVAQPSMQSRRFLERDEVFPSIFVSVRNPRVLDARQYLPVGSEQFSYEFTPLLDTGVVQVRAHSGTQRMATSEAASAAANHIDRVARQLLTR